MAARTRRSHLGALHFLGMLFLVMSHSKIIVRAQQVTLNGTDQQAIAQLLANALAGVSLDLSQLAKSGMPGSEMVVGDITLPVANTTTTDPDDHTAATGDADPLMAQMPNLARLMSLTNGTAAAPQRTQFMDMLRQQQSGGSLDIPSMERAAAVVHQFLNGPKSLGDGSNLQNFLERLDNLKQLRDQVSSYLDVAQLRAINGYLLTATQLGLAYVAAFPLAELAFMIALLALGAAITGLLAAIFYCVGSALAVAASAPGLPGPAARAGGPTIPINGQPTAVPSKEWFKSLREKAQVVQMPFLELAFSSKALAPLQVADTVLSLTDDALGRMGIAA